MAQPHETTKRPAVTLGDKEYTLKFRLSDLHDLWKNHSIDLFTPENLTGMAAVERAAIILAAGIAHESTLTPADVMSCIEIGELPIYALAIVEAQKKASAESQKASAALATMAAETKRAKEALKSPATEAVQ